MHVPNILPDEFFLGYRSRLGNLNCHANSADTNRVLRAWLSETDPSLGKIIPCVYSLSKLLNMDMETFIKNHTLTPITSAIRAKRIDNKHYLTESGRANLVSLMTLTSRKVKNEACFCAQCVTEDMHYHGFSYWRRSHQLSGVDWCAKHENLLFEVPKDNAYKYPPGVYFKKGEYNQVAIENYSSHPVVSRYAQMISDSVELRESLQFKVVGQVLLNRLNELDIRDDDGKKKMFSDVLNERVPHDWLKKHFPKLLKEKPNQYICRFDDLPKARGACKSFMNTILAAALIYKSAEEGLSALTQRQNLPRTLNNHAISSINATDTAYIDQQGNIKVIAETLNLSYATTLTLLRKIGFPSLRTIDKETLKAIYDFYNGGDLVSLMRRPDINLNKFQNALRIA